MRQCGILMPVSALPGAHGIGSLGSEARQFVDFLAAAGQQVWQILPLSPTGYGDSPYQSCSAFAGNPYFIDLDILRQRGLLTEAECAPLPAGRVNYGLLYTTRLAVLERAWRRWRTQRPVPGYETSYPDDWYRFCFANEAWLDDYALYMTIKETHGMTAWLAWPQPLRRRDPEALEAFRAEQADRIEFWKFVQYLFDGQWRALKEYANDKGVKILGDIPIYAAADSADAWAGRELFETDEDGAPVRVAGCPPDYFSADGQLWGNPLYNWAYHKQTGYAWWKRRLRHALELYDIVRIDHFRAFDTYYAIPADAATARTGKWEQGPGLDFFREMERAFGPQLPIVAEDLGELFDSVRQLLRDTGLPGMKVLQFAFGGGAENEYLPHNYPENCVVYPGTHDNTTTAHWLATAPKAETAMARAYFGLNTREGLTEGFIRGALASPARLAVIPMADWLGLGAEGRINTPGRLMAENWSWRCEARALTGTLAAHIREKCALFGRCEPAPAEEPETEEVKPKAEKKAPAAPARPAAKAAPKAKGRSTARRKVT